MLNDVKFGIIAINYTFRCIYCASITVDTIIAILH